MGAELKTALWVDRIASPDNTMGPMVPPRATSCFCPAEMAISRNIPLAAALVLTASLAHAVDCPPFFYSNLPRDREWYYGVGRDKDVGRARDMGVINLAKMVTGEVGGWDERQIWELAGPGFDRATVAATVGEMLPGRASLLGGWEQDDHVRCKGQSYVLVRVEKSRVNHFIRHDKKLQRNLRRKLPFGNAETKVESPAPVPVTETISAPPDADDLQFKGFQPSEGSSKTSDLLGGVLVLLIPGGVQFAGADQENDGLLKGLFTLGATGGLIATSISWESYSHSSSGSPAARATAHRAANNALALATVVHLWGIRSGWRMLDAKTGGVSLAPTERGVEVAWSRRF